MEFRSRAKAHGFIGVVTAVVDSVATHVLRQAEAISASEGVGRARTVELVRVVGAILHTVANLTIVHTSRQILAHPLARAASTSNFIREISAIVHAVAFGHIVNTSAVRALESLRLVTEAVNLIREISTIIHVVALKVVRNATPVSARELIVATPAEDFIRIVTALVFAVTHVTVVLASVVSAHEGVNPTEAFAFLVGHDSGHLGAIFLSVAEPSTRNAHLATGALVLVVRALLAEQLVCPIMAVIVEVAFQFLVNAVAVSTSELSRRANPTIGFI